MRKSRFIDSVVKEAKNTDVRLPWERGARRAEFITRRIEKPADKRAA